MTIRLHVLDERLLPLEDLPAPRTGHVVALVGVDVLEVPADRADEVALLAADGAHVQVRLGLDHERVDVGQDRL